MLSPRRVVITLLVALALFTFVLAFTLGEDPKDPATEAIELLIPSANDVVLQQNDVGVDLKPGFLAIIAINGVRIPEDQINCRDTCPAADIGVDPQNRFVFTPGAGKELEELPSGRVCAVALIWKVGETELDGQSVPWCFRVGA